MVVMMAFHSVVDSVEMMDESLVVGMAVYSVSSRAAMTINYNEGKNVPW